MFGEKKITFYEDNNSLEVIINWFTPLAFFLLFFSIAWNAFLGFWYTMAMGMDAPWIFKVFPIVHVAVGIGLIYYTLCLFFNKSYINIEEGYLTVRHKPIPWWKGNKEFDTSAVEQFYVKEKKSKNDNNTQFTYELRAKMNDKSDLAVLSLDDITSQKVQEIEERLEHYLGISDFPVKGEYSENNALTQADLPRRQRRDLSASPLSPYYTAKNGDLINLKGEKLEIISTTQYDWNDGDSDKLFQLINSANKEKLLLLKQNKALLDVFQENPLSIAQTRHIKFRPENPPQSLQISGRTYSLNQFNKGKKYISGIPRFIEVEQWMYVSNDGKNYLRVVNNVVVFHFYEGVKLQITDFEDILDLNNLRLRDIELEERLWEDEDLV